MIIPEDCAADVMPVVPEASGDKRLNAQTGFRVSKIANFRDFGGFPIEGTNRRIKDRILFRSAAPTYASEEDKEVLLDKLDILTLIDLRTTYETKHLNFGRPKYEDNFLPYSAKVDDGNDIDRIDRCKEEIMMEQQNFSGIKKIYKGTPRVGARRRSISGVTRKRYSLPLLNSTYFFNGLYPQVPAYTKFKCSALRYVLRSDKVAAYVLLKHLNNMGLFEMYKLTVEFTKREILTVFRIFKNPDNYPISFFCSLGKDRTGMISALLLSCLGVNRELIIENFHQSEEHLAPTIESIKAYFNKIGLTNEEFVKAPPHVMRRLLEYLDHEYGSIPQYLDSIGFSFDEQRQLADILTYDPTTEITSSSTTITNTNTNTNTNYVPYRSSMTRMSSLNPIHAITNETGRVY
jgi:protein tyrosine/serine phosphatase